MSQLYALISKKTCVLSCFRGSVGEKKLIVLSLSVSIVTCVTLCPALGTLLEESEEALVKDC